MQMSRLDGAWFEAGSPLLVRRLTGGWYADSGINRLGTAFSGIGSFASKVLVRVFDEDTSFHTPKIWGFRLLALASFHNDLQL